jgi:hypothetical protein
MTVKEAKRQTDHCRNGPLKQVDSESIKTRFMTLIYQKHKNKLYIHLNFTTN